MFIVAFLFIVLIYVLSNYYIGRKLYKSFKFVIPGLKWQVFSAIYGGVALITILSFLGVGGIIKFINAYWMGLFAYLFMFSVITDIVFVFLGLIRKIPFPESTNNYLIKGLKLIPEKNKYRNYQGFAVIFLSVCLVGFGIFNATTVVNTEYHVDLKNCDMKIVLISDLHLGAIGSEERLEKVVCGVNEKEPDIVCIAGDIFDSEFSAVKDIERVRELLSGINSKYGVYACLGNHDAGKSVGKMIEFVSECGITLLKDEYTVIDERLILVGRAEEYSIGKGIKRQEIKKYHYEWERLDMPVVVMDHNPGNIREYGNEADLILCGHTHKGQIFPVNIVTNMIFDVDYGHYKRDEKSPDVIVTSGVSTWGMPMRIGSDCEIVTIYV